VRQVRETGSVEEAAWMGCEELEFRRGERDMMRMRGRGRERVSERENEVSSGNASDSAIFYEKERRDWRGRISEIRERKKKEKTKRLGTNDR
jgi:hypothetical protein